MNNNKEIRIKQCFEKSILICICLNKIDWNRRIIGYVKQIYKNGKFKLLVIDEFGQGIKVITVAFNDVKSLEIGGIYNANLEVLYKKKFNKNASRAKYINVDKSDVLSKIKKIKAANQLCTFFFKSAFLIGFINNASNSELVVLHVGFDGRYDGKSILDIRLLTQIRHSSNFENRIIFLLKSQNLRLN